MITMFIIFFALVAQAIALPACHDVIPFSIKLDQSPVILYGDIIEASAPASLNHSAGKFNITFLVKCALKGSLPTDANVLIEHSLPDNPICYRKLVNGNPYVFFVSSTEQSNFYQQNSFHELLFNDDATVEILRKTCGIQTKSFHQRDDQCPIVSVGCI